MNNTAKCQDQIHLEVRFCELWSRCLRSGIVAPPRHPWHELHSHYNESHRFYHTLLHIGYCLNELDQARTYLDQPDAVEMALWFHDVIHSPNCDNERQSCELFSQLGNGCFSQDFLNTVRSLIMATTHKVKPDYSDQAFICDIDLSSLGAPWKIFLSDSHALRLEHSHDSDEEFYRGKLKFFESLLSRQQIFHTDYFREKFEENARQNIGHLIADINNELSPP